jgi:Fe-S-cluster-containing hydrogenase component 2
MARAEGVLTIDEILKSPGWPGEKVIEEKRVAVLECVEDIPCNPCEAICPVGAIVVGSPITNLPVIDGDKCTGCYQCIAICPGLAVFVIEKNHSEHLSSVSMPYEFLPLPKRGDRVRGLNRKGEWVCDAQVESVVTSKKYDKTIVVTVTVEKKFCHVVRSIQCPEENKNREK